MESVFSELLKVLRVSCKNYKSITTVAFQEQVKLKIHICINKFCVLMTTEKIWATGEKSLFSEKVYQLNKLPGCHNLSLK